MDSTVPSAAQPLTQSSAARAGFHVMTKPVGPICNLDCSYCFYLEKESLYDKHERWRMSDEVLESYIRQYIEQQDVPQVSFAWQGGEPTLLGVDFFRKVVDLQARYANGKQISNAIQTNGTLLDDEWCTFLTEHQFLVGLSIDGPRELHDRYRVDKQQRPTFDAVMRGLDLLKRHRTEFNTLTVVNRANANKPLDVYRFLKKIGSGFIQFIPLVERMADEPARHLGLTLAQPPVLHIPGKTPEPTDDPTLGNDTPADVAAVASWSVLPRQYGEFLVAIFEEWRREDIGQVFVQAFDVALGNWMGLGSSLCVFAERCGSALALEHNGDLYSCDHYVYPRHKLGNLLNTSLGEMVRSPQQVRFGNDKADTLPSYCRSCEVRFACNGECPKHRFMRTPDGEPGLNYLCPGYKRFFNHVAPWMVLMGDLLRAGFPPAAVRTISAIADGQKLSVKQRCPCGSGLVFGACCSRIPQVRQVLTDGMPALDSRSRLPKTAKG